MPHKIPARHLLSVFSFRFSKEPIVGTVGLVIETTNAAGDTVEARLEPMKANASHEFIPEPLVGGAISLIEKIDVLITNQVVKTYEKAGGSTSRYIGVMNRATPRRFGPEMENNKANWYVPMKDSDLDGATASASDELKAYCTELKKAGNSRYMVSSELAGFPFGYDRTIAAHYGRPDLLENKWFPENTHITVLITLKSKGTLRSLLADAQTTTATRTALWSKKPRMKIDGLWLCVDKAIYPEGNSFVSWLNRKRFMTSALQFPITSHNEIRENIHQTQSEQRVRLLLQQMGNPLLLHIFWMAANQIDGSAGANQNASVFKWVPNLDSFDVSMNGASLLATGGRISGLSSPSIDSVEKKVFYEWQQKYRRVKETMTDFYATTSMQQFATIPLDHVYAGKDPSEWSTLSPVDIDMGFTTDLSPQGYQIVIIGVCEGRFALKADNSHYMINAAGIHIDGP